MKKKGKSIKEIAKLSGVSTATISRVINDKGGYTKETKQRILDIIRENNYEINSIAKSLRVSKSDTIGIIVPDISNEFFSTLIKKIESYFFNENYTTIICNTDYNEEKESEYLKILENKMVDGLIIISGQKEFSTEFLRKKIPVVCVDRKPIKNDDVVFIESDHYNGGFLATEKLIKEACKNILIIINRSFLSSSQYRLSGYKKALNKYNMDFKRENMLILDINNSKVKNSKEAVLKKYEDGITFDGIFATNDQLAIGAMEAVSELNLRIPQDVKIIGFDNDSFSKYTNPPLTTIHQNHDLIVERTCKSLIQMINGENTEKYQNIPVKLIKRKSI